MNIVGIPLLTSAVLCLAFTAYSSQIAYWDFNEGADTILHDRCGNGNDGVIRGATWSDGYSGKSLFFDGVNDYVELQNPANFKLQQFTLSCWIKPIDPYVSQERVFFSNMEAFSGTANGFTVRFNQYLSFCLARADSISYWINMDRTVTLVANQYHFVAASYDGSVMRLYFDSTLVGETKYSGGVKYGNVKPNIGAAQANAAHLGYYKGDIDEMRIFNSALSTAEIRALYLDRGVVIKDFLIPVSSPIYDRTPVMTWHSIADAVSYNVEIDTVGNFVNPMFSIPTSDTFYQMAVDLPIDTIFWRVIAGINDSLRYYSTAGSFAIIDSKIPILIPYEPKVTIERRPTLNWFSVNGVSSYTIQIANNDTFTNALYNIPVSDSVYRLATDLPLGPIFWRVKSDLINLWSTVDMFTIQSDTIPMLIPFNGASVSNNRPVFKWHPVPNADSYKIEIADHKSFSEGYSVPVSDTMYSPTVDLNRGLWYWRVSSSRNAEVYSVLDSLWIDESGIISTPSRMQTTGSVIIRPEGRNKIVVSNSRSIDNCQIRVYNLSGKQILSQQNRGKSFTIEVPGTSGGLYFVYIRNAQGVYGSKVMLY